MVADLMDLPPPERLKRYRALADDARAEANRAKGPAHEMYVLIAGQWDRLADRLKDTVGAPKQATRSVGSQTLANFHRPTSSKSRP